MEFGKGVSLRNLNNFRIGGPARDFVRADTVEDLKDAIIVARGLDMDVFVLGGGTNILVNDDGYNGLVLKPAFYGFSLDGIRATVGAGVTMSDFINTVISRGLGGLEWAGGLPGNVGGAVYGNAGAFGGEIKDSLIEVKTFNMNTFEIKTRPSAECRFLYRTSAFKTGYLPEIILQATFLLKPADKRKLLHDVNEKIEYRKKKHPLEYPNIGSIFKNVPIDSLSKDKVHSHQWEIKTDPFPIIPAAYLISKAELKGKTVGGAMVSDKHPNFIVNVMDARAHDVLELIEVVKEEVFDKFGIGLEEEVRVI